MLRCFLVILLQVTVASLFASNVAVSGKLVDASTGNPISYAAVGLQTSALATTTDEEGYFQMVLHPNYLTDTFIVNHLTYSGQRIPVDFFDSDSMNVWSLASSVHTLPISEPIAMTAEEILDTTYRSILRHFRTTPFEDKYAYRQYHKENGKYVRLLECVFDLKDEGYKLSYRNNTKQRLNVQLVRRSDVLERNGDQHGDHLVDLLMENIARYARSSVLSPRHRNKYEYHFLNPDQYDYDWQEEYAIGFKDNGKTSGKYVEGFIIIDRLSYAIKYVRLNRFPSVAEKRADRRWRFINGQVEFWYTQEDGYSRMERAKWYYNHNVYDPIIGISKYLVEETFELQHISEWDDINTNTKRKYSVFSELYGRKYKYESSQWTDFHMADDQMPSVLSDLGLHRSLEEQFLKNGE